MKRIFASVFALLIVVSVVGCGGKEADVIDLTNYDERLTYIEVTKIVESPKDYVGKTIKFKGTFISADNQITGEKMFLCLVTDTTACCSSYLEFVLGDEAVYPDDYPKDNAQITISGTLETFKRISTTYARLVNVTIEE